ncbi:hypothetical protein O9993_13920 [Vibrio lentus]|nr:hypothetical protein [Vibrio lentus]
MQLSRPLRNAWYAAVAISRSGIQDLLAQSVVKRIHGKENEVRHLMV